MKISFFMIVGQEERCVGIADMPESPMAGDIVALHAGPEAIAHFKVQDRVWRAVNKQKAPTSHMETQLHVLVERQ